MAAVRAQLQGEVVELMPRYKKPLCPILLPGAKAPSLDDPASYSGRVLEYVFRLWDPSTRKAAGQLYTYQGRIASYDGTCGTGSRKHAIVTAVWPTTFEEGTGKFLEVEERQQVNLYPRFFGKLKREDAWVVYDGETDAEAERRSATPCVKLGASALLEQKRIDTDILCPYKSL